MLNFEGQLYKYLNIGLKNFTELIRTPDTRIAQLVYVSAQSLYIF